MKKILALALVACAVAPAAWSQTSVGVSIGINQPGVYGRIDIGNAPPPRLIYPQPIIIAQSPVAVYQRPIYLYVPPGHQKKLGQVLQPFMRPAANPFTSFRKTGSANAMTTVRITGIVAGIAATVTTTATATAVAMVAAMTKETGATAATKTSHRKR